MDLFLTNTQLFISQLFWHSFWRHPFTAEDPLMSKWWNAKFPQICSDEEANSSTSWKGWVSTFSASLNFWVNDPFKTTKLVTRTVFITFIAVVLSSGHLWGISSAVVEVFTSSSTATTLSLAEVLLLSEALAVLTKGTPLAHSGSLRLGVLVHGHGQLLGGRFGGSSRGRVTAITLVIRAETTRPCSTSRRRIYAWTWGHWFTIRPSVIIKIWRGIQ